MRKAAKREMKRSGIEVRCGKQRDRDEAKRNRGALRKAARRAARSNAKREGGKNDKQTKSLIKINVLKNCMAMPGDVAALLAERTHSDVVQVIGRKIVLYRESKTKKKIELPKAKNTKE